MAVKPTFSKEVTNLLYATKGSAVNECIQCGTCSVSCPVSDYMDHSPRLLIAMINADMKDEVLESNTFWYCASCFNCTVRCPADIDIADMMYGLKRYSMWHDRHPDDLIGPQFSERFMKMIMRTGKSYEPALAPSYILKYGARGFIQEAQMGTTLIMKGRMPIVPARIKRIKNFKNMIGRIIPVGGSA
jgi:heterodisulfide reductase subunit C